MKPKLSIGVPVIASNEKSVNAEVTKKLGKCASISAQKHNCEADYEKLNMNS